jgi:nicotinamide-nucleotide amidase
MSKSPQLVILSIGNELLSGRTLNTNAQWLARQLFAHGFEVNQMLTIADTPDAIEAAVVRPGVDLILSTGGLGPTNDDITRKVLADIYKCALRIDPETLQRIEAYYAQRGRTLNERTRQMAYVPAMAQALPNEVGAAPGLLLKRDGLPTLIAMPGIPYEMQHLFMEQVLPYLKQHYSSRHLQSHTFRTIGIPESSLAQSIVDIEDALPPVLSIAYNPAIQVLDLRLTLSCDIAESVQWLPIYEQTLLAIEERIASHVFGTEGDSLEAVLGLLLRTAGKTIATAESCTGGRLAARILAVPGASAYCQGAVVAYANSVKSAVLGVPEEVLAAHGAVSEQTAIAMAKGVLQLMGTDYALSTTGVAGPDGGSAEKPVGTIWIGFADAEQAWARCFRFENDRERNIERTVVTALSLLWQTCGRQ